MMHFNPAYVAQADPVSPCTQVNWPECGQFTCPMPDSSTLDSGMAGLSIDLTH